MSKSLPAALASLSLCFVMPALASEPFPAALERGVTLFEAADLEAAEDFFAAIEPGADRAWADYYLGRIEFERGEWETAIEQLSASTEAKPGVSLFHLWLANAYVEKINVVNAFKKMGVAKNALRHFEEAVRLAPESLEARDGLVGYLTNAPGFAGGSREKAEQQVAELTALSPAKGAALRGRMHFNANEWKEAEAAYRSAIAADPEVAEHYYLLGFSLQQQEDYSGADTEFETALKLDPKSTAALYQIGRSAAFSGENLDRAIEALERYLAQPVSRGEPGHEHAQWRLGMVYEHRGEKGLAAQAYRAALAIDPKHAEAKKALARLD